MQMLCCHIVLSFIRFWLYIGFKWLRDLQPTPYFTSYSIFRRVKAKIHLQENSYLVPKLTLRALKFVGLSPPLLGIEKETHILRLERVVGYEGEMEL